MNSCTIKPAFNPDSVTVCCATDDNYVHYCIVMLTSLIKNSSAENFYDIVVLTDKLSDENRQKIEDLHTFLGSPKNISIRIHNVNHLIAGKKFLGGQNGRHLPAIAYIRLFIPTIFHDYNKVIYLDIDITILNDIALLYHVNLKENWVGACLDYGIMASILMEPGGGRTRYDYFSKDLGIKDPLNEYVCSGVMGFNIPVLIENGVEGIWLHAAQTKKTMYHDQDIINMICRGHVCFYDTSWNTTHIKPFQSAILPESHKNKVLEDELHPNISHWAWVRKPWIIPSLPTAPLWWEYARKTPFYEAILYQNMEKIALNAVSKQISDVSEMMHLSKYRWQLRKYRLLAALTFGKKHAHYVSKKRVFKLKIAAIEKHMK